MLIDVPVDIADLKGLTERHYILANFLYQLRKYHGKSYFYEIDNYDVKNILNIKHHLANKSNSFQVKFKNLIQFYKFEGSTSIRPLFSNRVVSIDIQGEYEQQLYEYLIIKIKENTDGATSN